MQPTLAPSSTPIPPAQSAWVRGLPRATQAEQRIEATVENARHREFVGMLRGYRRSGGMAHGDEVALMMRRCAHPDSLLARWIAAGEVLSISWRGELWLPLFQFDLATMARLDAPRRVAAELARAFDAWHLAGWFAQPNSWLDERAPVDVLGCDLQAVLEAARADRFVALG